MSCLCRSGVADLFNTCCTLVCASLSVLTVLCMIGNGTIGTALAAYAHCTHQLHHDSGSASLTQLSCMLQIWEAWQSTAPVSPHLYLYSSADALIPPDEVRKFQHMQAARGVEV